jgi:pyruvate dehydrogenase E2 component (dihydrolipoamide acetyltransferase)
VRQYARELGADLRKVQGTGRRGRIRREDVSAFVKSVLSGAAEAGLTISRAPPVDFSRFGPITSQPLSRIRRLAGQHLLRSWVTIPHVTHLDEADITELEAFRLREQAAATAAGVKLTLLAFLVKAVAVALAHYPTFNSSLAADGESLILKRYFHVGIAVNADGDLVVPVIRNVDQKGLFEVAGEIQRLSLKARTRGALTPEDIQGGCFTISNLGPIGGTHFTPIINPPEVAILGVSRAALRPVYQADGSLHPRLILPFSLSYDHRVVNGNGAGQLSAFLAQLLAETGQIVR